MYCPNCGEIIVNGKCQKCKKEISKELLKLSSEEEIDRNDIKACILAYACWPIGKSIKPKDKKLVNFHINQGFTLFLIELLTIASYFIPTIGLFTGLALTACCGLLIYRGISGVLKKEKNKLPLIGDYVFLK